MKRKKQLSNLILIGILSLFIGLSSCSYKHYKGLEKVSTSHDSLPFIFDTSFKTTTYLTDFEVFGNRLSGLTIIKKVELTNTFHVVFMSQIGLKYFDLEIAMDKESDWFRMNYIMESLNRDFIINALQTDFELLFTKYPKIKQIQLFQHPGKDIQEFIIRNDKEVSSYFFENLQLSSISLRKGSSFAASMKILEIKEDHPTHIYINNRKPRLKIVLKEIKM